MFSAGPSQRHHIREAFLFFDLFGLIFAIVCLGFSAKYTTELYAQDIDPTVKLVHPNAKKWSTAWFVFYAGTAPVLTIIISLINFILQLVSDLKPIYAIFFSPTLMVAWTLQTLSWAFCELLAGIISLEGFCYQSWVDGPADYNAGRTLGQVVVGFAAVMLYGVYLGYAINQFRKERRWGAYGRVESKMEVAA